MYANLDNANKPGQLAGLARAFGALHQENYHGDNFRPNPNERIMAMSYSVTVSQLFDSAATAVRHGSVAASIVAALSYSELDEHAAKVAECNKLLADMQAEADRRKPASTGGLIDKLSTAAADYKSTVTNVSRYFATAAGHIYRREVKSAMVKAANAVANGAAQPEDEASAIQFVADFVEPLNVPFVGVKRNQFRADYECLRARFIRLATASAERAAKADQSALMLAQLQAALDAAGIEIETATAAA